MKRVSFRRRLGLADSPSFARSDAEKPGRHAPDSSYGVLRTMTLLLLLATAAAFFALTAALSEFCDSLRGGS